MKLVLVGLLFVFSVGALAQEGNLFYSYGVNSDGSIADAEYDATMNANKICSPNVATRVSNWEEEIHGYGRARAAAIFTCVKQPGESQ